MTSVAQQVSNAPSGDVIMAADRFYEDYRRASAGSSAERVYLQVSRTLYSRAQNALTSELRNERDFQYVDQLGEQYYEMYRQASAGSSKESAALKLSRIAFSRSESIFAEEVRYLGPQRRYEMLQHYEHKYNRASAGSSAEAHYLRMKRIAGA
jgi:hypothetical protein